MDKLSNEDFDDYLLKQDGKIIHQVWFGLIPNKREAKKAFEGLKKYRNTWLSLNPKWEYICWDYDRCRWFMKTYFQEHLEMYDTYPYLIQKCDCVRYFLLYRYGGLYADMDYCCLKSWDIVLEKYPKDLYIVETPNKLDEDVHISNSLMYSKPNNAFWKHVFVEMQNNKKLPSYYGRHMTIMYTTGPCIVNRVYKRYKRKYSVGYYPYELFHPFGITTDIHVTDDTKVFAYHLQKGSWTSLDSLIINFVYKEYRIVSILIFLLLLRRIFIH